MSIDLEKIIKESDKSIEKLPVKDFSEKAYLNYSMYVILDRALPHISDGLKPVQRRILYAMSELSLNYTSKFKKSARTIGDVLGKFHPHGDTACYEAMVMLAQDFSYNHPFIEGQGNWGTQDDPKSFAAMRYTESRLTKFSDLFLNEIDMGTVDWSPNFDGTLEEPKTLPSKIPNILVNGSSGIAVGMSTDIPSHNLGEVIDAINKILTTDKISHSNLTDIIQGPDFPTRGQIVLDTSDLKSIYENGSGNVTLRSTYSSNGKEIIIDSIPYQSTTTKIIDQIQDQIYQKKSVFIDSVLDASDQENPVRIIIKTKGRSYSHDEIMLHLFFTTDLEKSIRVNLNMIGLDGKPQIKNLFEILSEWISYRLATIKNKLKWELNKITKRIHILESYIIVYKNLDAIISIIRNHDNPKQKLVSKYKFTDIQYEAIINIKLRNLAKLQEKNIREELDELRASEKKISSIVKSKTKLKKYLIEELNEIKKEFSRDRQTKISNLHISKEITIKQVINSEKVTAVLSKNGWIKFIKGHVGDISRFTFKTGDEYFQHLETSTDIPLVFIDEMGYIYNLDSLNISVSRGQGEPLGKYFQLNDGISIMGMQPLTKSQSVLSVTNQGYGFMSLYDDLLVKNKKGKSFVKTKNDTIICFCAVDLDIHTHYLIISADGYMLVNSLSEVPILSKGRGVKLINLPKTSDDKVKYANAINQSQSLCFNYDTKRNKVLESSNLKDFHMAKNRRGKKIDKKFLLEKGKTTYNIE